MNFRDQMAFVLDWTWAIIIHEFILVLVNSMNISCQCIQTNGASIAKMSKLPKHDHY